jgi:hypothetical protein
MAFDFQNIINNIGDTFVRSFNFAKNIVPTSISVSKEIGDISVSVNHFQLEAVVLGTTVLGIVTDVTTLNAISESVTQLGGVTNVIQTMATQIGSLNGKVTELNQSLVSGTPIDIDRAKVLGTELQSISSAVLVDVQTIGQSVDNIQTNIQIVVTAALKVANSATILLDDVVNISEYSQNILVILDRSTRS